MFVPLKVSSGSTIRKRCGDIVVKGSDCDPQKFILTDYLAVAFIIAFIVVFIEIFKIKIGFIQAIENDFKSELSIMKRLERNSIVILNAKRFLDDYTL